MKYLLCLLIPFNVFAATNFSTVVGTPIARQDVGPSATVSSLRIDFTNVQGYAIQFDVLDCTTCNLVLRFFSSVDGVTFVEITNLATGVSAQGTTVFNNINAFFKWMRIEVDNDDPVETVTVQVFSSMKVGL